MTRVKLFATSSLLFGAVLASPMCAAQGKYLMTGEIYSLTNTELNLDDIQFRLSPTVKVRLEKGKAGRLNDLKTGDYVGIKILTLGKKRLVDSIHVLAGPVSKR